MEGKLPAGEARIVGVKEGYIDFEDDDPLYQRHVPEPIRERMNRILEQFRSGEVSLDMPEL
jgi:simple sugar transport system substrate-binding protein